MAPPKPAKPYVEVRQSSIHQRGLFAFRDIREGTRVMEYTGEKVPRVEAQRRAMELWEKASKSGDGSVYIFTLNERYDVDGNQPGNIAKYANHSCDPNCEADITKGRIWIVALRDISAGEEIVYNYNFDLDSYEDHPCRCGAKRCVGYMVGEEYWPDLKKALKKKRKKEKRKKEKRKKEKRKKEKKKKRKKKSGKK